MGRRFQLVDVFRHGSLSDNPLAVVHDAEGLSTVWVGGKTTTHVHGEVLL